MICPLCSRDKTIEFYQDKKRPYWLCQHCELVYVAEADILGPAEEKAEYDKHQNQAEDLGYREFLNRCLEPLINRLSPRAKGLDFGCGPGPTLSLMAKEQGFDMENYDPFYAHKAELLKQQYDFITMTEVIEHVRHPRLVLDLLNGLLKPGGTLAVMTKRRTEPERFAGWHYKNDPTHIRFYNEFSLGYIAQHYGWTMELIDKDVVFFSADF